MRALWSISILSLALPALAQQPERLIGACGTTEHDSTATITARMDLASDGTLSLTVKGDVDVAQLQGGDAGPNLFPDGLTIALEGTGTWRAEGDSVWVDLQQFDYRINGLGFEEFLSALIDQMVESLVQSQGVPADQVPQFEQIIREQVGTQFSREQFEQEMMANVGSDLLGSYGLAYSLDGEVLRTVDEDGEAAEWKKASVNSAVLPVSWGQLKAGVR